MTTSELKNAPLAVMRSTLPRVAAALRRIDRGELDQHALQGAQGDALAALLAAADPSGRAAQMGAARLAQRGRTAGGVAVISIRGFISPRGSLLAMLLGGGGGGLEGFRSSLREAVGDSDIGSIILDIDSPGGLVDLVPETAAAIREARGVKPITAVANTTAASAAYWLAAQADELVVTPSGEVGSIGVFASHEDWSKYDEELGVKTTLVSAGKYKTEGNPYEPLSEEAQAHMQETIDELYGMFVADVAEGRKASESTVRNGYGEGRMLTASKSTAEGMADRIATLEETIAQHVSGETSGGAPSAGLLSPDEVRAALGISRESGGTLTILPRSETPPAPTPPEPEPTPPEPEPEDPPVEPVPPPAHDAVARRREALDLIFD